MTFSIKKFSAIAMGGVVLAFGLVQTQAAEGSALPGGQLAQEASEPSTDVIVAEANALLDRMQTNADNISRQVRAARDAKDVVKTLCLDDVLNQMNVATRSMADRVKSMNDAAKVGNAKRVQQDNAVLGALAQRGNELVSEANQCIGEETGTPGDTELSVTVDPSMPTTDTATPPAPTVISSPPVAASPTQ